MDLKFKTLTFKISGLCVTKHVFNHKSIPIYYVDNDLKASNCYPFLVHLSKKFIHKARQCMNIYGPVLSWARQHALDFDGPERILLSQMGPTWFLEPWEQMQPGDKNLLRKKVLELIKQSF